MKDYKKTIYIFDFDSTLIKTEALELLAEIVLKNKPNKKKIIEKIKEITSKAMEGKISFKEALEKRLFFLKPTKKDIRLLSEKLKKKLTQSIKRNRYFFKKNSNNIYVVSGGFKDYIVPVLKKINIREDHIFANEFIFDKKGNYLGFNKNNPLSSDGGKPKVIARLKSKDVKLIVIGDGMTDYQIRKERLADEFVAFTENVRRESVVRFADKVVNSFDDIFRRYSYPKNKIKALLLENIDKNAVELFQKEGYEVEYYDRSLPEGILLEKLKEAHILGIRSQTKINPFVLEKAKKLLTIGAYCVGVDQIDLAEATKKGIVVFNAPFSNTRSVAELIIGEIIILFRNIFQKSNLLHRGIWDKSSKDAHEIRGKKLGIIGYGKIGSQVGILAEALGMEVYFYNTSDVLSLGNAKKCKTMKELLKTADVITLHVDGRSENKNLISKKEFSQMKDSVIFLNASRGFVVDINALYEAIKSGKIKAAAIDVFPNEPKSKEEKFFSSLCQMPNVILTPHIGGSTIESQKNISQFVTKRIIEFINTGLTDLSVNFPQIKPAEMKKNTHRLLHIHKNIPGILASINGILTRYQANIEYQYLKTNELIGYVIVDINKRYNKKMLDELKQVNHTIKCRILY